mmetsp:Transcript_88690/g.230183  ORF Transcript_88690/g.230183 Transcript_88690/m.230183 type:complete len:106 (-) Transcript_88690:32-349(-)
MASASGDSGALLAVGNFDFSSMQVVHTGVPPNPVLLELILGPLVLKVWGICAHAWSAGEMVVCMSNLDRAPTREAGDSNRPSRLVARRAVGEPRPSQVYCDRSSL